MRQRLVAVLVSLVTVVACGGGPDQAEPSSATPAIGGSCATEGEETGISDGTLVCTLVDGALVWRRLDPGAGSEPDSTSGSIEGTPCTEEGAETGIPAGGTARCENEGGSLVWRQIGGAPPTLPDGVTCGSSSNPTNPLALPGDNENVRASLDAYPVECVWPRTACEPNEEQSQYQWYRTDESLVVDPRNPQRLLVGIERLGLYESLDRGASWHAASEEGILHSMAKADGAVCWSEVMWIRFDPYVPGRIYLNHGGGGTVESGIWQARGAGLYVSNDDGATWDLLTPPYMNTYTAGFAIDPSDPDRLYVGTNSSPQTDGSDPVAYVDKGLLWRSDDAGATWTELETGWGARTVGWVVHIDAADPANVLFGVFQYEQGAEGGAPTGTGLAEGWYRSSDRGDTWTPVPTTGPQPGVLAPRSVVSPDGRTIIDHYDETWVSYDGAATWTKSDVPHHVVTFDPYGDGERLYGLLAAERTDPPGDRDVFCVSDDAGRSWKELGALPPEIRYNAWNEGPLYRRATPSKIVVDPVDPDTIYVTAAGGLIARSDDGGRNWTLLTTWESFTPSAVQIR